MSLRDTNLRYAALKLIADTVDKAMKDEKAAHLDALELFAPELDDLRFIGEDAEHSGVDTQCEVARVVHDFAKRECLERDGAMVLAP